MDCNQPGDIDLHIHSTASDGTATPLEIVALALETGLDAIAITDHDTIAGSKKAIQSDIPASLKFLTGVEISASPPPNFSCSGSFHILGYSIDLKNPALNRTLNVLQEARRNRNPRIIERLNTLGLDITLEEVQEMAGDGQLGRPHIARCLVNKGLVQSINDSFNKYLAKGKPAYVDKYRVSCKDAVEVISKASGIPVLAHPGLIEITNDNTLENLIITLKKIGIKGIEAYYPEHSKDFTYYCMALASRHDLLVTGGTDFHGTLKPDVRLGAGKGNFSVPFALYEKLISAASTAK